MRNGRGPGLSVYTSLLLPGRIHAIRIAQDVLLHITTPSAPSGSHQRSTSVMRDFQFHGIYIRFSAFRLGLDLDLLLRAAGSVS